MSKLDAINVYVRQQLMADLEFSSSFDWVEWSGFKPDMHSEKAIGQFYARYDGQYYYSNVVIDRTDLSIPGADKLIAYRIRDAVEVLNSYGDAFLDFARKVRKNANGRLVEDSNEQ